MEEYPEGASSRAGVGLGADKAGVIGYSLVGCLSFEVDGIEVSKAQSRGRSDALYLS